MTEKLVLFLDFANIDRAATDRGYRFDYAHLLNYIGQHRFLIDAHCYVPVDPRNEHASDRTIEMLWGAGYVVNAKIGTLKGPTFKCDLDIEITMDVLRTAYEVKPDIIVLASGDVDFIPLVLEIRRLGIRVEVASLEDSASRDLILKCSGFISLDRYYQDAAIRLGTSVDQNASGTTPNESRSEDHADPGISEPDLRVAPDATGVA